MPIKQHKLLYIFFLILKNMPEMKSKIRESIAELVYKVEDHQMTCKRPKRKAAKTPNTSNSIISQSKLIQVYWR